MYTRFELGQSKKYNCHVRHKNTATRDGSPKLENVPAVMRHHFAFFGDGPLNNPHDHRPGEDIESLPVNTQTYAIHTRTKEYNKMGPSSILRCRYSPLLRVCHLQLVAAGCFLMLVSRSVSVLVVDCFVAIKRIVCHIENRGVEYMCYGEQVSTFDGDVGGKKFMLP